MNRALHAIRVAFAAVLAGGLGWTQATELVSVDSAAVQGNHESAFISFSADGRFVSFDSHATNLVPNDTNGAWDVFVHDRQTGATERISIDSFGTQGNYDSRGSSVSADGRFVAFASEATNLVPGDTNSGIDVFVRDRLNGTTERVSVGSGGAQAVAGSYQPTISADGRFVGFTSHASDLVAGDTNAWWDVFVRDRLLAMTERVSVASSGAEGNGFSELPDISADGRFVAFSGRASNFAPGDTNAAHDVFLRDRLLGTTERVSVNSGGVGGNTDSETGRLSDDGRFVAFHSWSANLVAGDTNGRIDVFVRDRQTATTERVSVSTSGAQGDGDNLAPWITPDGRFVVYLSYASNLVAGDTNATLDGFLRDRQHGTTERVTLGTTGAQADGPSYEPQITDDGRLVAFSSLASNLVGVDANLYLDVFVRDRAPVGVGFCFGDGLGTACPCGNAGAIDHGCASSANTDGALLFGHGSARISLDTLVLSCSGMPNAAALYFQGTTQHFGGLGGAFGDGLRCAGGSIQRLGTKANVGGSSQYPSGTDAPVSVRGMVTSAGVRTYQVWYRNAAAFCTPSTFNLSNGIEVQWNP